MNIKKLAQICEVAGVTFRTRKPTNSSKQYVYLFKFKQLSREGGKRTGVTRNVYLCPLEKMDELDEATLRAKIADLYAKIDQATKKEE